MALPQETARATGPGRGEVLAAIVMGGLGVTQVVAMPLLATLIAGAFEVEGAGSGLVGLANLLGTALGSLVVTVWLKRLPFRLTAILSALLACTAQLGVAFMPGFNGAVLMEALSGVGAGVLLALSAAIVGASANPDRGFAFILTLQAIVAVMVLLAIPALGWGASFLPVAAFLAGLQALLIPVSFALGRNPMPATPPGVAEAEASAFHPAVLLKAAAYFIFSAAVGVLWVFSGVLGSMAGLADGLIGQALAVGNIAAIAGSLLAAIITSRFGRIGPVLAVCLTLALSVMLLTAHMGLVRFYAASSLFLFAWGGGLPLLMGIVAEVDPTERITSLLPVLAFAGMGVGPALVSLVPAAHGLFQQVSLTTMGLTGLAFALFAVAHIRWRVPVPGQTFEGGM
ncbi:MFS transporter [Henriciella aquimarina]|uniref:MFS transporter n=1 Tax=Henriciella aquimarina TaxID=545261 RepID=UPI0009FEAB70|nr:MFS transporter [Henriciella aquimarina]